VENPHAPNPDPQLKVERYIRSEYLNGLLGLNPEVACKFSDNVNSLRRVRRKETFAVLVRYVTLNLIHK